ncbi:MAG TPA: hypothetical protein PLP05_10975 [Sedimentisphaerales bacterium]|nr:hypothetical protein [Sedimentisphaerales bacterium]
MYTLIKREIEDNAIIFIIGLAMTLSLVCWLSTEVAMNTPTKVPIGLDQGMYNIFVFLIPITAFLANALGAAQMYKDKNQKISAFLLTLATTRNKIISARIIAGIIWILMVIAPIAVTEFILVQVFPILIPYPKTLIIKLFVTMFVVSLCCYSVGLAVGDNKRRNLSQILCGIITIIILALIPIKGFGVDITVMLIILTAALLGKVWQKFSSAAL